VGCLTIQRNLFTRDTATTVERLLLTLYLGDASTALSSRAKGVKHMLCEKCKGKRAVVRRELWYPASAAQKNLCAACAQVRVAKPFSPKEIHNIRAYFTRYTLTNVCLLPTEAHFHGALKTFCITVTSQEEWVLLQQLLRRSKVFSAVMSASACSFT